MNVLFKIIFIIFCIFFLLQTPQTFAITPTPTPTPTKTPTPTPTKAPTKTPTPTPTPTKAPTPTTAPSNAPTNAPANNPPPVINLKITPAPQPSVVVRAAIIIKRSITQVVTKIKNFIFYKKPTKIVISTKKSKINTIIQAKGNKIFVIPTPKKPSVPRLLNQ